MGTALRQFLHQTRVETVGVFRSVPFLVILAFGILNVIAGTSTFEEWFGTKIYPVTHVMLQAIEGGFAFLLVIIVTFYSGEMIWKERSLGLDGVYDSTPAPNGVFLGAKLVAQVLVVAVFSLVGLLSVVGVQLFQGYYHLEPGLYAKGFALLVVPFALVCVLASFLQIISSNKFLGYWNWHGFERNFLPYAAAFVMLLLFARRRR